MALPQNTVFGTSSRTNFDKNNVKFSCPEEYGECNTCIIVGGRIASITRKVCDPYSRENCQDLYGSWFLCNDGCNFCTCGERDVTPTRMGCTPYDHEYCLQRYGDRPWGCGNRLCICTAFGIASYYP
ncbi:hypothetical protein BGW41_006756 [Actinomortierella wolfii]|nr:hypothetical protein BGW41_006756 [Actinomortierella wolfii]